MSQQKTPRIPYNHKQVSFYIPEHLAAAFDAAREELPGKSLKLCMTAVVALWAGLPQDVREALYTWAHSHDLRPETADPAQAAALLMTLLKELNHVSPKSQVPPTGTQLEEARRLIHLSGMKMQRDGFIEEIVRTYEVLRADPHPPHHAPAAEPQHRKARA